MQPPLNRERQECASSSTQTPGIGPLLKRFVQDDEAKGRGGLAVMFGNPDEKQHVLSAHRVLL